METLLYARAVLRNITDIATKFSLFHSIDSWTALLLYLHNLT